MFRQLLAKPFQLIAERFAVPPVQKEKYVDTFFSAISKDKKKVNVLFIDEHFLYDPDNIQKSVIRTLFEMAADHDYKVVAVQRVPSMKEPYTDGADYLEMTFIDFKFHYDEILNDRRSDGVLYIHDGEIVPILGGDSSGHLYGVQNINDLPITIGDILENRKGG